MKKQDLRLSIVRSNNRTTIAIGIIKYGAYVILSAIFLLIVKEIVGKTTIFQFWADANVKISTTIKFSWGLLILSLLINYIFIRYIRSLKANFGEQIIGYEKLLDPNRTSSGLNEKGETPEE